MRIYFDENFSPHLVAGIRAIQDGRRSEDVALFDSWFQPLVSEHAVEDFSSPDAHSCLGFQQECRRYNEGSIH
jgi:hypothetical protein